MTDPSNPPTDGETTTAVNQSQPDDPPARHGTLKKRGSVKRAASKRSKAETAGSTTLSPTSPRHEEHPPRNDVSRNPTYCPVPINADPTVVLSMRFQAWRGVIKELINYFKSISSIEDARSRNIQKLNNSLSIPFRDSNAADFFLESGGIQDIGHAIKERARSQIALCNDNSRKILVHIVPPLEKLRSDLQLKIKEIKGLSGDFKNSVGKEQEVTRKQLAALTESLNGASQRPLEIPPKNDPHLVKMAFERQLRHHLQEENFLHQAHRNIESSGRALEGLVVRIIRDAFQQYQEMLNAEATATSEFAATIGRTAVDLPVEKEWDAFVADAKDMVDPHIPMRQFKDIDYPGAHQVTLIRSGRLERKSKYLKSYSSAFYILTAVGYFHEFKSSHMGDLQVSLFLPHCTLGGHSAPTDKSHKFVLKGSQSGGMHRGHNWVFRAESHEEMLAWYHDIEQLVNLPHMSVSQRQTFIASHATEERQSGSSSPGLDEDEADEVPYSQINSIEDHSPVSPQRPPPGGSFPSETQLNDAAMYGQHSRAPSDVTSDLQPPRISRDDDVAAVFAASDLERPATQDGSIGDEQEFTVAPGLGVAAGYTAAGYVGAKVLDHEKELHNGGVAHEVASPHDAAQVYAGTVPLTDHIDHDIPDGHPAPFQTNESSGSTAPQPHITGPTSPDQAGIAFAGLAGGVAGAAVGSAISSGHQPSSEQVTPLAIETRPPKDKDVLPAELNGPTSTTLAPPTNTIRRSKSKKEIVEEVIADSAGNHPERGVMPGFWPATPAQEKDGLFA